MGGGVSSIEIERQERYVQQNYSKVANSLNCKYNRYQIEGKLRQEYNGGNNYGQRKDDYVLDYDWNKTKRR